MKTAKEIAQLADWRGDARVFELSEPTEYEGYNGEYVPMKTSYIIVSAADVPYSGPETYIFPARKVGDVFEPIDMMELEGSYRGGLDHAEALEGAGYAIEA